MPLARAVRKSFVDHLEELRWRLIASLAAIAIFSVAAYFFSAPILEFLITPLQRLGDYTLFFHSPYEAFLARLKAALFTGIFAASPVIITEIWLFMVPGLHKSERRVGLLLILASFLLFLMGAAFSFWLLLPWGLDFFMSFQTDSVRPLLSIGPYFSFLVGMILACGVLFDLPVILLGLVGMGILKSETLRKKRKWVIVSFFVVSAVLTPTTDPATQILLTIPLVLLYEACVLIAGWLEKRKG